MHRSIALIAHDGRKDELVDLVASHGDELAARTLVATDGTGALLQRRLGVRVERLRPGALGGDLQIAALVASGQVDMVVFLRDPLDARPHDTDVHALLKACDGHRVPLATNAATARLCLRALRAPARLVTSGWHDDEV